MTLENFPIIDLNLNVPMFRSTLKAVIFEPSWSSVRWNLIHDVVPQTYGQRMAILHTSTIEAFNMEMLGSVEKDGFLS